MKSNSHLLDTLIELQSLDRVARSGYSLRGVADPESVSEHSFHLVFLVWALAPQEPELDGHRAIELALVHDLAEARFGDLPKTAAHYLPAGAKANAESAALEEILAPLGRRAAGIHAEYAARRTPEARFVAACDKLQLLIKTSVYENWGAKGLEELRRSADSTADVGFDSIRGLLDELRRRRSSPTPL